MGSADVSTEALLEHIALTLREELDLHAPVTADSRLIEDLQLDSGGLTILAVALENRCRVKLSEADAAHVQTVGELCALVQQRVREAA